MLIMPNTASVKTNQTKKVYVYAITKTVCKTELSI